MDSGDPPRPRSRSPLVSMSGDPLRPATAALAITTGVDEW
ncbi:hypothetical protein OEM_37170 [Mycobacterium intracellulare subsp. yongonense 05-1390]|nr:hypothetical protein OEM_37170 [Mycobacterium intracellulare subsp. yongonense 05-1390]